MSTGGGEGRQSQLRSILAVTAIAALLVVALFSAIGSLNRDLYSAGGFVRQYLDALARHDTIAALALPGVRPTGKQLTAAGSPPDLPQTLLQASVLGTLTDLHLTADTESAPGVHSVTYEFRLDGAQASMTFAVAHTGTFAGVFDSWRFSTSPLTVLRVTVLHESTFTVNGLSLDTRAHAQGPSAAFSHRADYLAFAPAVYSFAHHSALLASAETKVPVTISGTTDVTVDAEPTEVFIKKVQTELNRFLDDCATEQVLHPSDCPFGIDIDDRVQELPAWSIAEYPLVTLLAGNTEFEMPDTAGRAHIVVEVQSLFDGEVFTRDEDVPFSIGLDVQINPDGSLAIQLH